MNDSDDRFVGSEEEIVVILPPHTPVVKYSEDQPREPAGSSEGGRFAGGGGGGGAASGGARDTPDATEGAGGHVSDAVHGADEHAEENPWTRVESVDEAYNLLTAEQRVILAKPEQVSTLLDKLANEAAKAKAEGRVLKINLCDVAVAGTNVFCAEHKGIERIRMPQLGGFPAPGSPAEALPKTHDGGVDIGPAFVEHLKESHGTISENTEMDTKLLKASQRELDGAKVATLMKLMEAGKIPEAPIYVTRDNYIIDGHHRWAAKLGIALRRGDDIDKPMPVTKIDADVMTTLVDGVQFSQLMGIGGKGMGDFKEEKKRPHGPILKIVGGSDHGPIVKYREDQARDDGGRFADEGGGRGGGGGETPSANPMAGDMPQDHPDAQPRTQSQTGDIQASGRSEANPPAEGAKPITPERTQGLVRAMNQKTEDWMRLNMAPERVWDRQTLANYTKWVQKQPETEELVQRLMADPDPHPAIEIGHDEHSQIPRDQKPVTFLLGWRQGGGTPIHDHGGSQVAVTVERGAIAEDLFLTAGHRVELLPTAGDRRQAERVTRVMHAPSTITIPAPYIHRMYNTEPDYAVSIHSYYPPLKHMGFYDFKPETALEGRHSGGPLSSTGLWEEDTKPMKGMLTVRGIKRLRSSLTVGIGANGHAKGRIPPRS